MAMKKFFPGRQEEQKNTSPFVTPAEMDNGERESPEFARKPRFSDVDGGSSSKKTVVVIEDDKQKKTSGKKKGNTGPVSVNVECNGVNKVYLVYVIGCEEKNH